MKVFEVSINPDLLPPSAATREQQIATILRALADRVEQGEDFSEARPLTYEHRGLGRAGYWPA